MSKDLFLLMREQEVHTTDFLPTKKAIVSSSKEFATNLLDEGNINVPEVYAQALRLKEALTVIEATLKGALGEQNFEEFGLKGTFSNGGDKPNFKEDEIWADLKKKLDERQAILKSALSIDGVVFDHEGLEVPKVSTTPIKSSMRITY